MRLIAISDTHSKHHELQLPEYQEGDILVHAGDITRKGELATVQNFAFWAESLPYERIIVIAGNHDFCFENEQRWICEQMLKEKGITYLCDNEVIVEGLKFYGSPWTPWFHDWAFNLHRGLPIAQKWAKIPDDVDILITHGPSVNNLGGGIPEVISGEAFVNDVGCEELFERMKRLKNLKYHIHGHIHEGYGIYHHDELSCAAVNASVLDVHYNCTNSPFILPIQSKENTNE